MYYCVSQLAVTAFGACGGPMVGVFLLAGAFPWGNKYVSSFLTFVSTSAPSCLSSSLLPSSSSVVYLLAPEEDNVCRKRFCTVVSLCFGIRCIGECIFLDLFYSVNLTSSCSHIPQIRESFFGLSIHLLRPPNPPSWASQSTFLGLPVHLLDPLNPPS